MDRVNSLREIHFVTDVKLSVVPTRVRLHRLEILLD